MWFYALLLLFKIIGYNFLIAFPRFLELARSLMTTFQLKSIVLAVTLIFLIGQPLSAAVMSGSCHSSGHEQTSRHGQGSQPAASHHNESEVMSGGHVNPANSTANCCGEASCTMTACTIMQITDTSDTFTLAYISSFVVDNYLSTSLSETPSSLFRPPII